jgi:GTP-binding protein
MAENFDDEIIDDNDDLSSKLSDLDEELAIARAASLRAGLDDYDLEDEDLDVLDAITENPDEITYLPALPVLAVVGRPNVGKSALVNRIIGRREAVVEDTPGVTRDRVSYKAEWQGRHYTLVDTGGWEPDAKGIDASVAAQAEIAIELSDAVLFVVDANVGATATDEHVVRLLRKTTIPVYLVANKVDDSRQEPNAAALWSLGLGEPYPVSALHGRGVADLLDLVVGKLPAISAVAKQEVGGPRRVAILGRPNVGKSSLLNKLMKRKAFARVSNTPGRTREIHFFDVNRQFVLADLPGYGYARISKERRAEWRPLIEGYLSDSPKLWGVVQLLDVRHDPTADDMVMLDFLATLGVPTIFAVTKIDKLKKGEVAPRVDALAAQLRLDPDQIVPFSSTTGAGRDELASALMDLLALPDWRTPAP